MSTCRGEHGPEPVDHFHAEDDDGREDPVPAGGCMEQEQDEVGKVEQVREVEDLEKIYIF